MMQESLQTCMVLYQLSYVTVVVVKGQLNNVKRWMDGFPKPVYTVSRGLSGRMMKSPPGSIFRENI